MRRGYGLQAVFLTVALLIVTGTVRGQRQVTISEAVDSAMSLNPRLMAAEARTVASHAAVRGTTGSFLPQLHVTSSYTRYEEPNIVTPIHQPGIFPPLDDEIYEANLQLSIPIFDGGRRLTQRRSASASVDENQATRELVRSEVLRQVAEVFLYFRQSVDQSALINNRLENLYRQLHDLKILGEGGRVSQGDIALTSSLIASMRSDSIDVRRQQVRLGTLLSTLMGMSGGVTPAYSEHELTIEWLTKYYPPSWFKDLNPVGPNVRASEARHEKAEANQSLASRSLWPEVSGYGSYLYRSGSDWEPTGEWAAGIKMSIPLFTGGSRFAKIKETAALAEASEEALRSAELEQESQLENSRNDYISALDRNSFLQAAVEEKVVVVQAHRNLYAAGRISLRDLHTQQTELLQLRLESNAQLYAACLAILQYEAVAGSLTREKAIRLIGGSE